MRINYAALWFLAVSTPALMWFSVEYMGTPAVQQKDYQRFQHDMNIMWYVTLVWIVGVSVYYYVLSEKQKNNKGKE